MGRDGMGRGLGVGPIPVVGWEPTGNPFHIVRIPSPITKGNPKMLRPTPLRTLIQMNFQNPIHLVA